MELFLFFSTPLIFVFIIAENLRQSVLIYKSFVAYFNKLRMTFDKTRSFNVLQLQDQLPMKEIFLIYFPQIHH